MFQEDDQKQQNYTGGVE